jgi:hypothetical protein
MKRCNYCGQPINKNGEPDWIGMPSSHPECIREMLEEADEENARQNLIMDNEAKLRREKFRRGY